MNKSIHKWMLYTCLLQFVMRTCINKSGFMSYNWRRGGEGRGGEKGLRDLLLQ